MLIEKNKIDDSQLDDVSGGLAGKKSYYDNSLTQKMQAKRELKKCPGGCKNSTLTKSSKGYYTCNICHNTYDADGNKIELA